MGEISREVLIQALESVLSEGSLQRSRFWAGLSSRAEWRERIVEERIGHEARLRKVIEQLEVGEISPDEALALDSEVARVVNRISYLSSLGGVKIDRFQEFRANAPSFRPKRDAPSVRATESLAPAEPPAVEVPRPLELKGDTFKSNEEKIPERPFMGFLPNQGQTGQGEIPEIESRMGQGPQRDLAAGPLPSGGSSRSVELGANGDVFIGLAERSGWTSGLGVIGGTPYGVIGRRGERYVGSALVRTSVGVGVDSSGDITPVAEVVAGSRRGLGPKSYEQFTGRGIIGPRSENDFTRIGAAAAFRYERGDVSTKGRVRTARSGYAEVSVSDQGVTPGRIGMRDVQYDPYVRKPDSLEQSWTVERKVEAQFDSDGDLRMDSNPRIGAGVNVTHELMKFTRRPDPDRDLVRPIVTLDASMGAGVSVPLSGIPEAGVVPSIGVSVPLDRRNRIRIAWEPLGNLLGGLFRGGGIRFGSFSISLFGR